MRIIYLTIILCLIFSCAIGQREHTIVNTKLIAKNPRQTKVMEFKAAKTGAIKWVQVYPLKIGPDRLTVSHNIIIRDDNFTRKIVYSITFPNNPSLPRNLDHAGDMGGVGIQITYTNGKEFYIFALFRQSFRGQGIEYKLSLGPKVETEDDPNLPGNYILGHGFSSELYELLHDAIESSTTESPIWIPSSW